MLSIGKSKDLKRSFNGETSFKRLGMLLFKK